MSLLHLIMINIVNFLNDVRDLSGLYNDRRFTLWMWAFMRTFFLSDGRVRRLVEMHRWTRSLASLGDSSFNDSLRRVLLQFIFLFRSFLSFFFFTFRFSRSCRRTGRSRPLGGTPRGTDFTYWARYLVGVGQIGFLRWSSLLNELSHEVGCLAL